MNDIQTNNNGPLFLCLLILAIPASRLPTDCYYDDAPFSPPFLFSRLPASCS